VKHKTFFGLFGAVFIALTIVGCSVIAPALPVPFKAPIASPPAAPVATIASPTSAPVATLARPTSAPAQPTAAPTTAAQPSVNYNGEWEGVSAKDRPLSFTIENNEMTFLNVNYRVESGPCQFLSGSRGETKMNPPIAVIQSKDINIQMNFDGGASLALTGAFNSNAEAAGKLIFKGNSSSCGAFEITTTWSAKKATASASSSTTSPASAPIPVTDGSASKTLRAFFDALNAKNADAALALVDDTIVFNIGSTTGLGKAQLKTYLQGQISRGVTYTPSNLDDQGDTVDFSLKTGNGAATDYNTASFGDDGKIDFLIFQ